MKQKHWVLKMTFKENITDRQYHYLAGICHNLGTHSPALDFDTDEKHTADEFYFSGSQEQLREILYSFITRSPGPHYEQFKVKHYELYEETGLRNVLHTMEHCYYFAETLTERQKGFLLSLAGDCVHLHVGDKNVECQVPSEQAAMFDADDDVLQKIAFEIIARADEFELDIVDVQACDSRVPTKELIEKAFVA